MKLIDIDEVDCKVEKKYYFLNINSLILLFGIALFIRITGLLWGGQHPDENLSAATKVLTGQLIPDSHYYPPFFNYLNAIAYGILYGVGRLIGVWWNPTDFRWQYFENPTPFLFSLRCLSACLGAAAAPLAALIAYQLQLQRSSCLIVGGLIAIAPASVLLSHISKHDIGLSSAILLVVWLLLKKVKFPTSKPLDLFLGIAIALALSFKQSAIFLLTPLGLGFIIYLKISVGWKQTLQSVAIIFFSSILLWSLLNVGLILDFKNFLEYQSILKLMWQQEDRHFSQALYQFGLQITDYYKGATLPAFLLWLALPIVRREPATILIWSSTLVAILLHIFVSKGDATEFHLLPYNTLIVILAGIAATTLLEKTRRQRFLTLLPLLVLVVVSGLATIRVTSQAITSPINKEVASTISQLAQPGETRILSSSSSLVNLLPIASQARKDEYQRHERLAKKYGVELPEQAQERSSETLNSNRGYYIRFFPWVMGKLEVYEENELKIIKPYSWPLQSEEWQLNYWLDRGFSLFIVENETDWLNSKIDAYRQFHRQIHDRCQPLATIEPKKPLFGELQTRIYQCQ
jgi:hypothetical protein